nr:hypothetical protein [Sulfurimonas sp.]
MRHVLLLVVLFNMLFGNNTFDKFNEVKLKTILKASHKSAILNIDFYKNEKLLTLSQDGMMKIWDIKEQEMLKSVYMGKDLKEVVFSKDGTKIYALNTSNLNIYNSSTYKLQNTIKVSSGYCLDMEITSENEVIIVSYYYLQKYNLKTGKLIYSVESDSSSKKNITLSSNQKYIAVSARKIVKVYRAKSGEFISKLPKFRSIKKIDFIGNKNI